MTDEELKWSKLFDAIRATMQDGRAPEQTEMVREFWKEFWNTDPFDLSIQHAMAAEELASNWDTCACGSLDDGIPRVAITESQQTNACPVDGKLEELGLSFYHYAGLLQHTISMFDTYVTKDPANKPWYESSIIENYEKMQHFWNRIQKRGAAILNQLAQEYE